MRPTHDEDGVTLDGGDELSPIALAESKMIHAAIKALASHKSVHQSRRDEPIRIKGFSC